MTPDEAKLVVTERFDVPLPLRLDRRHRLAPLPSALGATAHVDEAIARARNAAARRHADAARPDRR